MRCTQATLEALGIKGKSPKSGMGVVEAIQKSGCQYRLYDGQERTVKQFIKTHSTGKYYLSTNGHAMALVDGKLTDTTGRGADGRHLVAVIEVL